MIRNIIITIILCLNIFVLNGCNKPETQAITLAVGGAPAELVVWETIISEFTKKTGIKVEINRQATDTDQRRHSLVISLRAKQSDPDVFLMDVAWIAQFAAAEWLAPLNSFTETQTFNINQYFPNIIDLADTYKEELIALPLYIDGGLLYYRKDLFAQYGISKAPQTWTQLIEFSRHIQKNMREVYPDFYGFVWQGAQYEGLICNFIEYAVSNSGGIQIENKQFKFNTKANKEALQVMVDLIHTYKISPPNTYTEMKEEEVRMYFQKGLALFERNWPYAWSLHQEANSPVKDKVGIAPLPHFINEASASTLGGWHVGISKYSDETEKSWILVKYLTSFDVQKKFALQLGWNPSHINVYKDSEVLSKLPHFKQLQDVFKNAIPRPNLPYYTAISYVLQKHINKILAKKTSIEAGLERAEKEVQRVIDQYEK